MWAAGIVYAALAVVLISPGLLPGHAISLEDQLPAMEPWKSARAPAFERPAVPSSENSDSPLQLEPLMREAVDRLPDPPLWNPHIMGGRPLLADAQSAPFSPLNLPAYVVGHPKDLTWLIALKLWVAALGTFALGRALGMRLGGALLAGLAYGFGFWMIAWATFPHSAVLAWLPWMLLATDRLVRRPDLVGGALLSLVTGAQLLAGQPESSFHVVVVTVLFGGLRMAQLARGRVRATLLTFAAALLGGLALAAAAVVPFVELLLNSSDLTDRAGTAIDAHLPLEWLLGIFLPGYWGRATGTLTEPFQLTRAYYVGALPLMLATVALVLRPRVERIFFGGIATVCLAVVFGVPPIMQLVTRLPLFSSGHTGRLVALAVFALALLAGWGLDELTSGELGTRRARRVVVAAAVVFAIPLVWALARGVSLDVLGAGVRVAAGLAEPAYPLDKNPEAADVIRVAALVVWLAFAGAALLLLGLRVAGRLSATAFVLLVLALVAIDLFKVDVGFNPAVDQADLALPASGALEELGRHPDSRFVAQTASVPDNVISLRSDLMDASGYDLPLIKRYDRLWRSQIEPECPTQTRGVAGPYCIRLKLNVLRPEGLRALQLLGVRYLLQPATVTPAGFPGLTPVYEGRDGRVYSVDGAMPRAWVGSTQRVVGSDAAALAAVTAADFDPREAVIVERSLPGVPTAGQAPPRPATILRDEEERVTVRAEGPGVLVLGDTWFPGWKASVDGDDVDVAPVDYVLRGVPLTAGVHTVDFRYQPLSWTLGWIVSLVAAIGIAVAIAVGRRRG